MPILKAVKTLKAKLRSDREVRLEIDMGANNHYRWTAIDPETDAHACRSVGWGFDTVEDAVEHAKDYLDVEDEATLTADDVPVTEPATRRRRTRAEAA